MICVFIIILTFFGLRKYFYMSENFISKNDNLFISVDDIDFDLQSNGRCHDGSYPKQNHKFYNSSKNINKNDCKRISRKNNLNWLGEKKNYYLPHGCLLSSINSEGYGVMYNNEFSDIQCGIYDENWGSIDCLCEKRNLNI